MDLKLVEKIQNYIETKTRELKNLDMSTANLDEVCKVQGQLEVLMEMELFILNLLLNLLKDQTNQI